MGLSVIVFACAAAVGLTLAILRFRGKEQLPLGLALLHGAFAAGGLLVLTVTVLRLGDKAPSFAKLSNAIFVAAALGGFLLFSFQLRKKPIPIALILVHATAAVTAFGLLAFVVLGG